MFKRVVDDILEASDSSIVDAVADDVVFAFELSLVDVIAGEVVLDSDLSLVDTVSGKVFSASILSEIDTVAGKVLSASELSGVDKFAGDVLFCSDLSVVDAVVDNVLFDSDLSLVDTVTGKIFSASDLSVVDTVTADVLFGDDSLSSVAVDGKGVLLSSGFKLVSVVADNGVLGSGFSLVVGEFTTGNFWGEACSDIVDAVGDNCVGFSRQISVSVVLFNSEVLVEKLTGGTSAADLLDSSETLFDAIRLGLVRMSPKSESSLPIRGSTSEFVASERVLLVAVALVLASGMLLISFALLIIKASASARLNSDSGGFAVSIKLSCSEFSGSPGIGYNKGLLVLIPGTIECWVGASSGIKDSGSSIKSSPIGSVKGTRSHS